MATYVYRIRPDGSVSGLWHDMLAGMSDETQVKRASEVEYDSELGGWTVRTLIGIRGTFGPFAKRAEALEFERRLLNHQIREGGLGDAEEAIHPAHAASSGGGDSAELPEWARERVCVRQDQTCAA